MKRIHKSIVWLLLACMLLSFSGCSQGQAPETTQAPAQETTAPAPAETTAPAVLEAVDYAGQLTLDMASGTAKVVNLTSNVAALCSYLTNEPQNVLFALALPAALCSILGSMAGARYALRGGSKKVRGMIFLVLGLLFIKVLSELVL